jgi:hypothetical protein
MQMWDMTSHTRQFDFRPPYDYTSLSSTTVAEVFSFYSCVGEVVYLHSFWFITSVFYLMKEYVFSFAFVM